MSKHMQKDYKNFDKILYKILYQTLAVLRSLNNAIKMAYETRLTLDKKEASKHRQDIAIKAIYPNYQLRSEVELLFGKKLETIITKENEKNKFSNDAIWQKQHSQKLSN
ncbi:8512_t:CDS:2, partial [Cetraspora pellucida]